MDRGTASSTILVFLCFLFFLFTFSSARSPFYTTMIDIDHANHDSFSLHEKNPPHDDANSILLSSEKPEFEPATLIQLEPETETTNSKTPEPKAKPIESKEVPKESSKASNRDAHFTAFSFRPIDPRIPRRPLPLSFRVGHRCHHNHHYKPWKPRHPRREITRRNDVTLNNVELDKKFDKVVRDWVRRQVPAEWMRPRHIEPMFSREPNMALDRRELWKRIYLRRHHHDHRHKAENKDTGLMKRIRKFLNHF